MNLCLSSHRSICDVYGGSVVLLTSRMCGDGLAVIDVFYEDHLFGAPSAGGNHFFTTT